MSVRRQLELPGTGILVECRSDGPKLRVVPASPGFEPWNVAFPRALRRAGARFWVRSLRAVAGKYYRAAGPFTVQASAEGGHHGGA